MNNSGGKEKGVSEINGLIDKSGKNEPHLILVVDDEEELVRLLTFNLEHEGYRVKSAYNGADALEAAHRYIPDLIILDIMLPQMDGLEVCRRLRSYSKTSEIPIMMLSARRDEFDRVLGLEMGADDYVVKPFGVREIIARVKALLRRHHRDSLRDNIKNGKYDEAGDNQEILEVNDIILDPNQYRVKVRGTNCPLTQKEFQLLHILMSNIGKVLTRDKLLSKIWGYDTEIDTRTVDVHIRYLRQKIEEDPANPRYLITVRGVGYRFESGLQST